MTSRPRVFATVVMVAACAAVPLSLLSARRGEGSRAPSMARAKTLDKPGRDLSPVPPETVGVASDRLHRLDAAMKRLVDDKQVAGLVTLFERHGKVVDFSAFGQRNVQSGDPLQKDAIFRIYSMTKPVTGVAMMMLYEEGKWRLEDPVSRYIPAFAKLKVYTGKNDEGAPKLEDAKRSLTMRELMTHTGGLGYVLNSNNPVDKMIIDANVLNPMASLQTMIDGLAKMPLLAQPGTRWSYS